MWKVAIVDFFGSLAVILEEKSAFKKLQNLWAPKYYILQAQTFFVKFSEQIIRILLLTGRVKGNVTKPFTL